jgi:hypothetical protein
MGWQHVNVIIVPEDQPHVSIMKFVTEGNGNVLPEGAAWVGPEWWIRSPEPALIEKQILKWRALDSKAPRPAPIRWFIAESKDIPTDREYRNSQVAHPTEAKVEHDMTIAKELHREKLRTERVERLLLLDYDWMAATRAKDQVTIDAIDAKKVELLNITDDPRIEAAQTIDELKSVTLPEKV